MQQQNLLAHAVDDGDRGADLVHRIRRFVFTRHPALQGLCHLAALVERQPHLRDEVQYIHAAQSL